MKNKILFKITLYFNKKNCYIISKAFQRKEVFIFYFVFPKFESLMKRRFL